MARMRFLAPASAAPAPHTPQASSPDPTGASPNPVPPLPPVQEQEGGLGTDCGVGWLAAAEQRAPVVFELMTHEAADGMLEGGSGCPCTREWGWEGRTAEMDAALCCQC
jgi:hypothetical protein